MFNIRRVVIVLMVVIGLSQIAGASGGAVMEWNAVCAQYNFDSYPQGPTDTFYDAYFGPNFNGDFAAIKDNVSQALSVRCPDIGGNDVVNFTIENW